MGQKGEVFAVDVQASSPLQTRMGSRAMYVLRGKGNQKGWGGAWGTRVQFGKMFAINGTGVLNQLPGLCRQQVCTWIGLTEVTNIKASFTSNQTFPFSFQSCFCSPPSTPTQ